MQIKGYMIEVSWDGETLIAEGTTKPAQVALRGQDRNEGPVVIPRADVARVELKPAKRLTNGNLTVHTTDGSKYQLHFLRKHADAFEQLATDLQP